LHALPKAKNFYKRREMINFGVDTEKEVHVAKNSNEQKNFLAH
jgi:hypothetical protein